MDPNIGYFPADLQGEREGLERRRRLADTLMAQGMAPLQGRQAGGLYVAPSPLEGLAKALQMGLGVRRGEDVQGALSALGQTAAQRRQETLAAALSEAQGTPEQVQGTAGEGTGSFDMSGTAGPAVTPGTPGNPLSAYARLAASGDPLAMQFGGQMLGYQQREREGAENRAARKEERAMALEARAQDAALSRAEREAARAEAADLRREMVTSQQTFAAQQAAANRAFQAQQAAEARANRQPAAPVAVMGPDGPIYVPPSQAYGKTPATGAGGGKAAEKNSELNRTVNAYAAARDGLLAGLEGSSTGPLAGRLPAMTSSQQVAEGGVSAMAPVLKQIFRVAGEGTFTDKDQELLMKMVPTRADTPQARADKIANIDNIISAKMGIPIPERKGANLASGKVSAAPVRITGDADYNRLPKGARYIGPDGVERVK